jgi:methionine aminopeptidase
MIHIKTPGEIAVMREGGKKLGTILNDLLTFSQPGVVLMDIEKRANELIERAGATASFSRRGCFND